MSDNTDYNYPTADDQTLEFTTSDDASGSLGFSVRSGSAGGKSLKGSTADIPEQIGDYAIKGMIGQGGMGQVFLAEHIRMQRIVAVKMLPVERMADESLVERFYDEVRAASSLMHPNIVTAFDCREDNGVHFLAMEYVDGETLTDIVAKNGPLSVGDAAAVIRQAALGLLHAHRAGIVHRDVKPGNLMRAKDGTVKVLDLGLARVNALQNTEETDENKKMKGRLTGTLPFMAPEQLEDPDSVDARCDIYALGATLYFLLTSRTPYTGEFLDIIYGHRHGEIPDLMQSRDDVDMRFANIFTRMMAKSPSERYASLDEVIDDLSEYASKTDTPVWMAEYTDPSASSEASTASAGSTMSATAGVLAIDVGMFYSATAEASPSGDVRLLCAGGGNQTIFRMAVASDPGGQLLYGSEAIELRAEHAKNVVHCLPMYIGKSIVEREIAGRQCPPEVLMAMMFRQILKNAWPGKSKPHATAMTVPASYDQLHRQSVLQAAEMAGLRSVRLVDRSIACVQSLTIDANTDLSDGEESLQAADETILFVGVTGQATEVALIRRDGSRLNQLATGGHWHTGTLPWLHRLVDLTAREFVKQHKFDPRKRGKTAARLQIACEKAMNSMLLLSTVTIKISVRGEDKAVKIQRRHWLHACEDLAGGIRKTIKSVCRDANISLSDIRTCVTQGPMLRISNIRNAVLRGHHEKMSFHAMDRSDAARGAAACLAAELPGRGDIARPPRGVTSQTIGILINTAKGRRVYPIIPKGTSLPARTNRTLSVGEDRDSLTLSLVESSGVQSDDWHSLGRYDFHIGDADIRKRMIGFEVNVNGLLTVRAQAPGTPGSTKLPPLPAPDLSAEKIAEWTEWLNSLR